MIDADIAEHLTKLPTRRDRWGRYQVLTPAGKLTGYTRATTIAKTLDDQSALVNWKGRVVAQGLAARPDLLAAVATTDPDDKKALGQLCERAAEAGGATARRDLGTALHTMLERSWTEPGYQPPAAYAADVAAVHAALAAAGLTVVPDTCERIVVNDNHQIAGTFDLAVTDGATTFIADVKTGSSMNYGAHGFAIQLAIYATADCFYTQGAANDGTDDHRAPMLHVSQDRAVIIHVQPESGTCDLHWLDLTIGRHALELALAVRDVRKTKPLLPIDPTVTGAPLLVSFFGETTTRTVRMGDVATSTQEYLDAWIGEIVNDDAAKATLGRLWPDGIPTRKKRSHDWTDKDREIVAAVLSEVAAAHGLAFPALIPPDAIPPPRPKATERRPDPDEGDDASEADIKYIRHNIAKLDGPAHLWFGSVISAAAVAGRSLSLKDRPSLRRFAIAFAVLAIAQTEPHDDVLRALVGMAIGEEVQPGFSLGLAVGSLNLDEAERLYRLAHALGGALSLAYAPDGAISVIGNHAQVIAA